MPTAFEDPPETPKYIRRAVEVMTCDCGHTWMRIRDVSGFVNRVCGRCGKDAATSTVRTERLLEDPGDATHTIWDD